MEKKETAMETVLTPREAATFRKIMGKLSAARTPEQRQAGGRKPGYVMDEETKRKIREAKRMRDAARIAAKGPAAPKRPRGRPPLVLCACGGKPVKFAGVHRCPACGAEVPQTGEQRP